MGVGSEVSSPPHSDEHHVPEFPTSEIEFMRDEVQPHVMEGTKRTRKYEHPRESSVDNNEAEALDSFSGVDDTEDDQDDLDDYNLSRSSSPSIAPSAALGSCRASKNPGASNNRTKTAKNKKKRRAKGSAALALAVVTQIEEARRQIPNLQQSNVALDEFDPIRVYREGNCVIRKRKNQPIPVPVPVPNLIKKCRGRKVPFVADHNTSNPIASPFRTLNADLGGTLKSEDNVCIPKVKRTRCKGKSMSMNTFDENTTARSYVCTVLGCGKCFVRGEHLKRHIRSIHTHEKREFIFRSMCICSLMFTF